MLHLPTMPPLSALPLPLGLPSGRAAVAFLVIVLLEVLQPFRPGRRDVAEPLYYNPPANWRLYERPLPADYQHDLTIRPRPGPASLNTVQEWLWQEGVAAVASGDPPVLRVRMPARQLNRLFHTDMRIFIDHEGRWQVRSLVSYVLPEPCRAHIDAVEGLTDFPPGPVTVAPFLHPTPKPNHAGPPVAVRRAAAG
eukprot:EG_transcript_32563